MYQRLPASATDTPTRENTPVLKVFEMVEGREEYEMVDLLTGEYLVCAEVRLGNTSLQSDCFKTEVDSPEDEPNHLLDLVDVPMDIPLDPVEVSLDIPVENLEISEDSPTLEPVLEVEMIIGVCVGCLALVGLASYSVFWLVVTNRRRRRER